MKVAYKQLVAPSVDSKGRYLVGAAVGTRQEDRTRVDELRKQAEVDVVILDSSQGRSLWTRVLCNSVGLSFATSLCLTLGACMHIVNSLMRAMCRSYMLADMHECMKRGINCRAIQGRHRR